MTLPGRACATSNSAKEDFASPLMHLALSLGRLGRAEQRVNEHCQGGRMGPLILVNCKRSLVLNAKAAGMCQCRIPGGFSVWPLPSSSESVLVWQYSMAVKGTYHSCLYELVPTVYRLHSLFAFSHPKCMSFCWVFWSSSCSCSFCIYPFCFERSNQINDV